MGLVRESSADGAVIGAGIILLWVLRPLPLVGAVRAAPIPNKLER